MNFWNQFENYLQQQNFIRYIDISFLLPGKMTYHLMVDQFIIHSTLSLPSHKRPKLSVLLCCCIQ
jgi:hypothetical protein